MNMQPLILVPGLNCTAALFAPQVAALGTRAHCRIADHGSAASLDDIAAKILSSAPPRFALAGLSMGGYVAFEIVRQAPERVERLCLIDTRSAMDTAEDAARRRQTIALAESGRFDDLHGILWPRLVHPSRQGDAKLEAVVLGMMRDTGPERFIRQQTAVLNRRDYAPTLRAMRMPVSILVGDSDVITPPQAARLMQADIPGATLSVIPGCGHLSTLEMPEAVNSLMRTWLLADF
jgi:pimeloyl-ACP methyl ester carboxylesterase